MLTYVKCIGDALHVTLLAVVKASFFTLIRSAGAVKLFKANKWAESR